MDDWILETERLRLRKLTQADFENLCGILQDAQAMYAYEHAFSDQEVQAWLDNQLRRYQEEEFGAAIIDAAAARTWVFFQTANAR